MLTEHCVITQETVRAPRRVVRGAVAAVALPLLIAILTWVGLVPGSTGETVLWLVIAGGAGVYFWGWRIPLRYLVTDTHVQVRQGLLNTRWVPLDQIDLICRAPDDDDWLYSGFAALGDEEMAVIINPQEPPQFRVVFTPSDEFVETLLWATNRTALDPWPYPQARQEEQ